MSIMTTITMVITMKKKKAIQHPKLTLNQKVESLKINRDTFITCISK